jgi:AcrR family transcriptional regulator
MTASTTATSTATPGTGRPGRHRSEAADEAITAATLELLGELGYGGVTMAGVIERAGVSSATLYRRFSNKDDLVAAAVATLVPSALEIDTGSLAGDLKAFIAAVSRAIVNRREEVMDALGMESKRNESLRALLRAKFLEPRLDTVRAILTRAQERGELDAAPPDDVAFSLIIGPCYHRAFVWNQPLGAAFQRAAADCAEHGLRDYGR